MTRIEYDLLCADRPELRLSAWTWLNGFTKKKLEAISRETLISRRTAQILTYPEGLQRPGAKWTLPVHYLV